MANKPKTFILGHSIVRRLHEYMQSKHDPRVSSDFHLSKTVSVHMKGIGGLRVHSLLAKGSHNLLGSVMLDHMDADVVILQLGGNDFANGDDADTFAVKLLALASLIRGRFNVKLVIVGSVLPRFVSARPSPHGRNSEQAQNYCVWAQAVNELHFHARTTTGVLVWKHARFTFPSESMPGCRQLMAADGVHLSKQGQYRLFKSLRGALINGVHRLSAMQA